MIPCEDHAPPSPVNPETHTWDCMKHVRKVERCSLEPQRLPNDRRLVPMAVSQKRRAQRAQRRVFPYEALVDGRRCYYDNGAPGQDLLERPSVMVCVAVGEDYAYNGSGADSLALEGGRAIGRGVNHDASAVDPKDVSGG